MKRFIILFAVLALGTGCLFAQDYPVNEQAVAFLKEDPTRAGGNTHAYEFNPIVDTPAPAGYKPVYVSHYARHGSRSNMDPQVYERLIGILEACQKEGLLTAEGEALLSEAKYVNDHHNGMNGRLTARGVREHRQIAERLYHRVPSVFRGNGVVRAISSVSPRAILSMTGFTNEMARLNPKLDITLDTGEKFMAYISDSRTGTKIPDEIVERIQEEKDARGEDTVFVMNHLFTDPVKAKAIVGSAKKLNSNIYHTAIIARNFDLDADMFRHIPFSAIYPRWSYTNKWLYYHNGNSLECGEWRMPHSESLVEDIVEKADEALSTGSVVADLRFGHDWALYNLVSYLGIEGISERLKFEDIDYNFYAWREICMASNLQMIFYKNKKGNVLVKFLYQEKERLLRGLQPVQGPYYDWETVKANIKGYLR